MSRSTFPSTYLGLIILFSGNLYLYEAALCCCSKCTVSAAGSSASLSPGTMLVLCRPKLLEILHIADQATFLLKGDEGPINTSCDVEKVRQQPYNLPSGCASSSLFQPCIFQWVSSWMHYSDLVHRLSSMLDHDQPIWPHFVRLKPRRYA